MSVHSETSARESLLTSGSANKLLCKCSVEGESLRRRTESRCGKVRAKSCFCLIRRSESRCLRTVTGGSLMAFRRASDAWGISRSNSLLGTDFLERHWKMFIMRTIVCIERNDQILEYVSVLAVLFRCERIFVPSREIMGKELHPQKTATAFSTLFEHLMTDTWCQ